MAECVAKKYIDGILSSGKKIYSLAPLAGFSDAGMRKLCVRYGADYTVTEMVSAKGLIYENSNTERLLTTIEEEPIKCVQLFGREPEIIARAIRLPALQKFDLIDFNFGCPMRKIISNGEGSALLNEPETVYKIIRSAVDAADGRMITAKIRIGFEGTHITAVEVAKAIEEAGGSMITVHGRTREQLYSGVPDYEAIKKVKESVHIPVIANGDVTSKAKAEEVLALTDADGVAIGRGAVGRPYFFSELKGIPFECNIKDLIGEHLNVLMTYLPERTSVADMKKHVVCYVKGIKGASSVRDGVMNASSKAEMMEIIDGLGNRD